MFRSENFFFSFLFSISSLKNGKKRWLNEEKLFENNFWWDCAQGKTLIPTVRLIWIWQSLNVGQVWIEFERPLVENPFFRYLMVTMTVDWCGCVSNGFNKRLLGYSDWELNKKVIWCQLKKIRCNKMLQLQRRLFALQRETIIFDRFKMK